RSTACNNNSEYCSSKARVCSSPKRVGLDKPASLPSLSDPTASCGFTSTFLALWSPSPSFRESNSFFITENVSVRRPAILSLSVEDSMSIDT
uniref:Uncharacterized protein n=1 Tax=Pelodiscus sinensis TaxID=13735 RepID=K7EYQ9_PELSI